MFQLIHAEVLVQDDIPQIVALLVVSLPNLNQNKKNAGPPHRHPHYLPVPRKEPLAISNCKSFLFMSTIAIRVEE
jgi:hypothetical protein